MSKNFLKRIMQCFLVAGLFTLAVRTCANSETATDETTSVPMEAPDCLRSLPDVPVREDVTSREVESEGDKLEGQEALSKYSEAHLLYSRELGYATGRAMRGDASAAMEVNTSVSLADFPFKVGRAFAKAGNHESAIACFTESLTKKIASPNDASAYLNRGESYLATGQKALAQADYQKAVELFRAYKLSQYEKMATEKLRSVTP